MYVGFPGGSDGKESACSAGDQRSIPGLGRSSGEGNGNPLQYSCLEDPMGEGAWQATIHGVIKSWTQLSDFTFTFNHNMRKNIKYYKIDFNALFILGTGPDGKIKHKRSQF